MDKYFICYSVKSDDIMGDLEYYNQVTEEHPLLWLEKRIEEEEKTMHFHWINKVVLVYFS